MPRQITLFNTASRSLETFKPINENKVGIYACGPTVYNYAHIGNLRTYVFEDILRRMFEQSGYEVKHVMNITDVGHLQSDADEGDDKMLLASKREQKSPWEIADFYTKEFFRHCEELAILRPNVVCKATDHISEMIAMVEELLEKGYAYVSNNNVYFDVSVFDGYADFAHLNLDAGQSENRVEIDTNKRNQADFCLWFSQSKFPNQIMKWESPWGVGFPGWHIECSAMSAKYLGKVFDIHCGGVDHIPVHHTNEIAQSDCCHGHKSVNYWMHGEFLTVDAGKMSKSAGEFLTVDSLINKGFAPLAYRYLLLGAHYRSELKFSFEALAEAQASYESLREKVQEWKSKVDQPSPYSEKLAGHLDAFNDAMREDLHTPKALSVLWTVVRDKELSAGEKLYLVTEFDKVLGLQLDKVDRGELSEEEQSLIKQREDARTNKEWAESDRLRDKLLELGIVVKDSKDGTEWHRSKPN